MRTLWCCCWWAVVVAAADVRPDPASVQRCGPAYRYPQDGWIVLHVEGKPYERGYQQGKLLATEIAAYLRCFATQQDPKTPSQGWSHTRRLANALFVRKFDREYLEEMQGIADGAAEAGATFDGRKLDLIDIVALNVWAEIDSLDSALDALPTGLEGVKFPKDQPKAKPAVKGEHCSAFVATGPATADGKIVIGHITMFGLYPARFYNVWLDIKPEKGHRILMQSYPGGIQSGMDYYMNDAGLVVCETTIDQTRFNGDGVPVTQRIRKALQYGSSIDDVVKILQEGNNGLYANEWLIADTKTNEIAMFELGTKTSKLWRSSKGEWFGGTEGFYWGCNNTKDLQVRLEAMPSVLERPENVVWNPSKRDQKWLQFYAKHKGKITAEIGKDIFSTPPICARSSLDAKITSTAMAKELRTHALFGPPLGGTWQPAEDKGDYPEMVPLVPNDWTILHPNAPASGGTTKAIDLPTQAQPFLSFSERLPAGLPETKPAWRGTLLPATDADVWLTASFAAHERIVAWERSLPAEEQPTLEQEYALHRAAWLQGKDIVPATDPGSDLTRDRWLKAQTARGVLMLHHLQRTIGTAKYVGLMEQFGRQHAGKTVQAKDFIAFMTAHDEAARNILSGVALPPNTPKFTLSSWKDDMEATVIVYGTKADRVANRETAEQLQKAIQKQGTNYIVPILSDEEALAKEPQGHCLLIGGPTTNKLAERWRRAWPTTFETGSFRVGQETYAHTGSALLAVGTHPTRSAYSVVLLAGLSAEATQFLPPFLLKHDWRGANVVTIPALAKAKPFWLN